MEVQNYDHLNKEKKINTEENYEIEIKNIPTDIKKIPKKKYVGVAFLRYLIFVITLWIVFTISFILGFILHYDLQSDVTFSSILWTFSFIIFVIATIFTILYRKAKKETDFSKKISYLKFFPV